MFHYTNWGIPPILLLIIMIRLHLLTITLMLALAHFTTNSKNYYCTFLNNFEGFGNCEIVDGKMSIVNTVDTTRILLHQSVISDYKYRIVSRLSNRNNQENKAYSVEDSNGNVIKRKNTMWGMVFNYVSEKDFYAIELRCENTSPYDMFDKRIMVCEAVRYTNHLREVIATTSLQKDVNLHSGDNILAMEYDNDNVTIKLGEKKLKDILSFSMISRINSKVGVLSGAGADVRVERFVIKQERNPIDAVKTNWNKGDIEQYLLRSNDVIEGYWQYLDRDIDERKIKLGGRYTLALVKNDDGYDIVYIDGAEVLSGMWKTGFLKGKLRRTPFQDHYDMVWYDATFKPFNVDVYATVENASVLTFYFPIQKSSMRFYKKVAATN